MLKQTINIVVEVAVSGGAGLVVRTMMTVLFIDSNRSADGGSKYTLMSFFLVVNNKINYGKKYHHKK